MLWTAADDQVLGAAGEADEPVGVDGRQVAGVKPTVLGLPAGVHLAPGPGAHEVAGEDVRAAQDQCPDLVLWQERPVAGGLVDLDGARLLIRETLTDRAQSGCASGQLTALTHVRSVRP